MPPDDDARKQRQGSTKQRALGLRRAAGVELVQEAACVGSVRGSNRPETMQSKSKRAIMKRRVKATVAAREGVVQLEAARLRLDSGTVRALTVRRHLNFANKIKGSVLHGRLSRCLMSAYAAPSFAIAPTASILIPVFGIPFYERLGASLSFIALFQALALGLDLVNDPLLSYATDSCRSRFGRRRPFIAAGSVLFAVAIMCLLSPPAGMSSLGTSVWFGIFYICFFFGQTVLLIPLSALGPELTDDQDDRNALFFRVTLVSLLGTVWAVLLPLVTESMFKLLRPVGSGTSLSCDVPDASGHITVHSCTSSTGESAPQAGMLPVPATLTSAQVTWRRPLNASAASLGLTSPAVSCAHVFNVTRGMYCDPSQQVRHWCECRQMCTDVASLDNSRLVFQVLGFFFAAWVLISGFSLVRRVKERSQLADGKQLKPAPAMVPAILNAFANRPFVMLLPSWVCDAVVPALVGSILTYVVRYIVQPEYTQGCDGGHNPAFFCHSSNVVGVAALCMLLAGVVGAPVWLVLVERLGRRNTWLIWSLTMALTNLMALGLRKGSYATCFVAAALNGLPMSAKFLEDALMSDIIDYDEFLTGQRSEATYMMFKTFLPKLAAIPASAIPIALLGSFGHIPPKDGKIQEQIVWDKDSGAQQPNMELQLYLQVVSIWFPSALALLSFLVKARFPIKTRDQTVMIAEGIGNHLLGKSSRCPVSGLEYAPLPNGGPELEDLSHFPGVAVAEDMDQDPVRGAARIRRRARFQLALALAVAVVAVTGVCLTFDLLGLPVEEAAASTLVSSSDVGSAAREHVTAEASARLPCSPRPLPAPTADTTMAFVPVLFIVLFGSGITLLGLSALRLRAASRLVRDIPRPLAIKQALAYRRQRAAAAQFEAPWGDCFIFSCGLCCGPCARFSSRSKSIQPEHAPERELRPSASSLMHARHKSKSSFSRLDVLAEDATGRKKATGATANSGVERNRGLTADRLRGSDLDAACMPARSDAVEPPANGRGDTCAEGRRQEEKLPLGHRTGVMGKTEEEIINDSVLMVAAESLAEEVYEKLKTKRSRSRAEKMRPLKANSIDSDPLASPAWRSKSIGAVVVTSAAVPSNRKNIRTSSKEVLRPRLADNRPSNRRK